MSGAMDMIAKWLSKAQEVGLMLGIITNDAIIDACVMSDAMDMIASAIHPCILSWLSEEASFT